jgi:hypothetical protein
MTAALGPPTIRREPLRLFLVLMRRHKHTPMRIVEDAGRAVLRERREVLWFVEADLVAAGEFERRH